MTLLQINATYAIGSTGRITKDIHNQALKKGINSYVACAMSAEPKETYIIGNELDHKLHAFLCRINGRQAYFSKCATKALLNYMDQIKPDIVHIHNLHNNFINLNMLLDYIAEKNIRLVITLHDCWYYTGRCFHYTFNKCFRWKEGCGNCPERQAGTPVYFFDKSAENYLDKKKHLEKIKNIYVIGASQWIANEARLSLLQNANISYCYNGVDMEIFKPQPTKLREQYNIKPDDFVILGIANKLTLPQNKQAMEAIYSLLDENTKLVVLGAGTRMFFDDRVIRIPTVKEEKEMAQWYASADVFVNLTWEDTLGFVNVEAIACGTPVITQLACGSPEVIDENTGIVIEAGDKEQLTKAILEIRRNGKKYYEAACVERTENLFNAEHSYDKYFDIYEKIIERM